jgi:hypothetical protein
MAQDESEFKAGFKKDLIAAYPTALIWTNSDMFRAGLPDLSALCSGSFYAMELKFIKKLPKRRSSKCLTHEVSPAQLEFLNKTRENGHYAAVIIGLKDVAVRMDKLQENYTLDEVLAASRFVRKGSNWDLCVHFNDMRARRG